MGSEGKYATTVLKLNVCVTAETVMLVNGMQICRLYFTFAPLLLGEQNVVCLN